MKLQWIRQIWGWFYARFPRLAYDLNYLRRNRRFEPDLWIIPRFCRREAGVIDVGANVGIFSRWMAKYAGRVDSFECNPLLHDELSNVLPSNVTLHRCALSRVSGRASLRFDPNNTAIGTIEPANRFERNPDVRNVEAIDVAVRRLDDFNFGAVSFIKIDVEGHELEVLKGASNLLQRDFPTLLIEIEERHCPGNLTAVPAWLRSLGYASFVLDGDALVQATDLGVWAARGRNNFWFRRCVR